MFKFLVIALTISVAFSFTFEKSDVVELDSATYEQINQGIWFMQYYASWCPHCQALSPTWRKLATLFEGILIISAIDAGSQAINVDYIPGFPMFRFLFEGNYVMYKGDKTLNDFIQYSFKELRRVSEHQLGVYEEKLRNAAKAKQSGVQVVDQIPSEGN